MSFFRRIMLSGGMPIDIPESRKIYYTASAKITPDLDYDILTNTWDSSTGEGVIVCKTDVTSIGDWAFYNCSSLTSVTIPDSVTEIGQYAFCNCSSLASVTIPNNVTSIGYNAFSWCSRFTSITIPDSVVSIGDNAFCGCSSITSVTIGNSVTSIGSRAFESCSSLTSVTIPDNVTSIGNGVFMNCRNLVEFNGKFTSEDKHCLVIDGALNSFAPAGITEYAIPDSVTSIGENAFWNCDNLASITIPDSVTSMGEYAFYQCSSLASVTIPDGVTTIGGWAFFECSSLTEVYCKPTTPPAGSSYMFHSNASGRKIHVPSESVDAYKAASYWSTYAADIVAYDFDVDEGGGVN